MYSPQMYTEADVGFMGPGFSKSHANYMWVFITENNNLRDPTRTLSALLKGAFTSSGSQ